MELARLRLAPPSWLRLPRRTARLRLTALYGGLFLLSGVALVAITYGLFERATEYRTPHLPTIPHTPAIQHLQLPSPPNSLLTPDGESVRSSSIRLSWHRLTGTGAGPAGADTGCAAAPLRRSPDAAGADTAVR